ncbi:low temperature requirement protein A [Plantactinospora sp. CA-290183]|uniref:low temperature requirement protein A n=1 Tax=Plantactinospora sp. CA-290183 TaxID=3240006 RepID=UPI003D8A11AA
MSGPASAPTDWAQVRRILFWGRLLVRGFGDCNGQPALWAVWWSTPGMPAPASRLREVPAPATRPGVGERIAERYRQFVIIALGASLFVTVDAFSQSRYTVRDAQALTVVFITTVLIWRIYIHRAGELMTTTIAASAGSSQLSRSAFVHLVIVAGIMDAAVGGQLVIERPYGDTPPAWAGAIIGGPALFLIGRLVLSYTVFAQVSRVQLTVGLLALAGLVPATTRLAPIMLLPSLVWRFLAAVAAAGHRRSAPGLRGAAPR